MMLVPLVYMIGKNSVVAMNYDAGPYGNASFLKAMNVFSFILIILFLGAWMNFFFFKCSTTPPNSPP